MLFNNLPLGQQLVGRSRCTYTLSLYDPDGSVRYERQDLCGRAPAVLRAASSGCDLWRDRRQFWPIGRLHPVLVSATARWWQCYESLSARPMRSVASVRSPCTLRHSAVTAGTPALGSRADPLSLGASAFPARPALAAACPDRAL